MVKARLAHAWRRHRRLLLLLIPLALVGGALLLLAADGDPEEEARVEYPQVEALVVEPVDFEEWIETTGTIEARRDALLTAEAGGTVVSVAEEGRFVEAGQIVAQLDPGQAAAAVRQAGAAVAEARAGVRQAEQAFERQLPLARDTIISPLEFERVRAQRQQALAGLAQALAMQTEVEQLLEQTRLRAPFAGVVEQRWVRTGEQVSPGQQVLRIVGPGQRELTAGIPERFAGEIRTGALAVVRLPADGTPDLVSSVTFVGNAIDPQSRTFPIRVELADRDGLLKADMVARVRVVRRVVPGALVLPREAVTRDEREQSVLVLEPLDTLALVRRRTVQVGPSSEQGVVIEAGLRAGEQVVILGQEQVVAGDTARVVQRYAGLEAYRAALAARQEAP